MRDEFASSRRHVFRYIMQPCAYRKYFLQALEIHLHAAFSFSSMMRLSYFLVFSIVSFSPPMFSLSFSGSRRFDTFLFFSPRPQPLHCFTSPFFRFRDFRGIFGRLSTFLCFSQLFISLSIVAFFFFFDFLALQALSGQPSSGFHRMPSPPDLPPPPPHADTLLPRLPRQHPPPCQPPRQLPSLCRPPPPLPAQRARYVMQGAAAVF